MLVSQETVSLVYKWLHVAALKYKLKAGVGLGWLLVREAEVIFKKVIYLIPSMFEIGYISSFSTFWIQK